MGPEEIEKHIAEIAWGGRYISARDSNGEELILVLMALSSKDKRFVDMIYENAIKEAKSKGIFTKFDLSVKLKTKEVWSEDDNSRIDILMEKLSEMRKAQEEFKKSSTDYKRCGRQITDVENEVIALRRKKNILFYPTAESYAEEIRTLAIVFCTTYDERDFRLWDNWGRFQKEADDVLIKNIIGEINNSELLEVPQIREIARSPQWRFRWNGAKTIGDLFGKSISNFTSEQQSLLYWSQVYDSVYEAHERPSDDIINDDKALDAWFESQDRKRKVDAIAETKEKTSKGLKFSKNISRHGEIFVVANKNMNPHAPSIDDVDSLNTSFIRTFKEKELERIKESGTVQEKDLRDRKNKIARKLIGSKDAVLGKSAFGSAKGGKSASRVLPGGSIG